MFPVHRDVRMFPFLFDISDALLLSKALQAPWSNWLWRSPTNADSNGGTKAVGRPAVGKPSWLGSSWNSTLEANTSSKKFQQCSGSTYTDQNDLHLFESSCLTLIWPNKTFAINFPQNLTDLYIQKRTSNVSTSVPRFPLSSGKSKASWRKSINAQTCHGLSQPTGEPCQGWRGFCMRQGLQKSPETTLKNRRNPTSPRDNTFQSLGLIFPCKKVLMDPVRSWVI